MCVYKDNVHLFHFDEDYNVVKTSTGTVKRPFAVRGAMFKLRRKGERISLHVTKLAYLLYNGELPEGLACLSGNVKEYTHPSQIAPTDFRQSIRMVATNRWYAAKNRAEKTGREFTITKQDVYDAMPEDMICPVLGKPMYVEGQYESRDWSPSLDRKDPSKGYTPDNIQVISSRANWIKADATLEELKLIVENWRHCD